MKSLFLSLLFLTSAQAAEWVHAPTTTEYLDLNPLRFTNRAECARDSKKPTKSFFILADSLNAGKALYRIGRRVDAEDSFSVEGVRRFRYTVFSLAKIISERLLKGELPLLKAGVTEFDLALKSCDGKSACPAMDALIASVWESSSNLRRPQFLAGQGGSRVSCHSLKSFSPLEAHLYGVKPDREALDRVAEAVHKHPELMQTCDESLEEEDLKVGVYQLDLRHVSDEEWDEKGFYYWNSFKLYFSWAFRFAPEVTHLAGVYDNVFRSIDLEESVIFFANGCKSMTAPECGKDYLNLSTLRSLARSQGNGELSKLDFFDTIPDGSTTGVKDPQQPTVNTDVLDLGGYSSAADWANNFRENIVKTRGYLKLKLTKSVSNLALIHGALGDELLSGLDAHTSQALEHEDRESYLRELYVTCSEFRVAFDEQTSFLRQDLQKLRSEPRLRDVTNIISNESMSALDWAFETAAPGFLAYCDELQKNGTWENFSRPSNALFAPWYQEYVFDTKAKEDHSLKIVDHLKGKPLLKIKTSLGNSDSNTLCTTPAHCGRIILTSLLDLKAFSEYASGFLSFDEGVKAPALFNPMSERLACRSYDPWFKTKKTIADLMQDIFLAAVWSFVPSPVYVNLELQQKKVVSFNELIKDGKVYYDPRFDKKRVKASLMADFGPLLGAPCAVAVSNSRQPAPMSYLALEGITLQTCHERGSNDIQVYGPDEIESNRSEGTGCFSCTISLSSVGSSVSNFSPGVRPFVFLVRGVVRLIQNLRDPHDIPRSWEVKPNQVYRSWRKHGSVYSSCKGKLRKGKECMSNTCEANIASAFEEGHQKYIEDMTIYLGGEAEINVKGEEGLYAAKVPRFGCALKTFSKEDFYRVGGNP